MPVSSDSSIMESGERPLIKSEYLMGLKAISLMSNKAIQAYRTGCIEINIFIVSEAM